MICTGNSGTDKADPSAQYKLNDPFLMWIEGLPSFDLPWLFDGLINMAHPEKGKVRWATLVVSGGSGVMIGDAVNVGKLQAIQKNEGHFPLTVIAPDKPIPWRFRTEEGSLVFVASESIELNSTKVAGRHYVSTDGKESFDFWTTDSGVLTKFARGKGSLVLVNYKQYRKLIPELPVEGPSLNRLSDPPKRNHAPLGTEPKPPARVGVETRR